MHAHYKKVKSLTERRKIPTSRTTIKDKNGKLLQESDDVRKRWVEYIEELYAKNDKPAELYIVTEDPEDPGPDILDEEVRQAIGELKNGKSEGIDNIPAEFMKNLNEEATKDLIEICQTIYKKGTWPKDFMNTK